MDLDQTVSDLLSRITQAVIPIENLDKPSKIRVLVAFTNTIRMLGDIVPEDQEDPDGTVPEPNTGDE